MKHTVLEQEVSFEMISAMFGSPIHQVAHQLHISVKKVRQICRENGVVRWPASNAATKKQMKYQYNFNLGKNCQKAFAYQNKLFYKENLASTHSTTQVDVPPLTNIQEVSCKEQNSSLQTLPSFQELMKTIYQQK